MDFLAFYTYYTLVCICMRFMTHLLLHERDRRCQVISSEEPEGPSLWLYGTTSRSSGRGPKRRGKRPSARVTTPTWTHKEGTCDTRQKGPSVVYDHSTFFCLIPIFCIFSCRFPSLPAIIRGPRRGSSSPDPMMLTAQLRRWTYAVPADEKGLVGRGP